MEFITIQTGGKLEGNDEIDVVEIIRNSLPEATTLLGSASQDQLISNDKQDKQCVGGFYRDKRYSPPLPTTPPDPTFSLRPADTFMSKTTRASSLSSSLLPSTSANQEKTSRMLLPDFLSIINASKTDSLFHSPLVHLPEIPELDKSNNFDNRHGPSVHFSGNKTHSILHCSWKMKIPTPMDVSTQPPLISPESFPTSSNPNEPLEEDSEKFSRQVPLLSKSVPDAETHLSSLAPSTPRLSLWMDEESLICNQSQDYRISQTTPISTATISSSSPPLTLDPITQSHPLAAKPWDLQKTIASLQSFPSFHSTKPPRGLTISDYLRRAPKKNSSLEQEYLIKYPSSSCTLKFDTYAQSQEHEWRHRRVKERTCRTCGQIFSKPSLLAIHEYEQCQRRADMAKPGLEIVPKNCQVGSWSKGKKQSIPKTSQSLDNASADEPLQSPSSLRKLPRKSRRGPGTRAAPSGDQLRKRVSLCRFCSLAFHTVTEFKSHKCPASDQQFTSVAVSGLSGSHSTLPPKSPSRNVQLKRLVSTSPSGPPPTLSEMKPKLRSWQLLPSTQPPRRRVNVSEMIKKRQSRRHGQHEKCKLCHKVYPKDLLTLHARSHIEERPYACTQCDRKYPTNYELITHIISFHEGNKPFKCLTCSAKFTHPCLLRTHATIHDPNRQRSHECAICAKKFFTLGNLRQHYNGIHNPNRQRSFECIICGKTFFTPRALRLHRDIHARPFHCSECGESYDMKIKLDDHVRTAHTKEKPFACEFCLKRFCSEINFYRHKSATSCSLPQTSPP